jgi:hypothetical protein
MALEELALSAHGRFRSRHHLTATATATATAGRR